MSAEQNALLQGESSRNVGDYDVQSTLSATEASEQIARAEKFLELARQLISPGLGRNS